MSKISVTIDKELRTECRHESGATLSTDAPKEFHGKAEFCSPTDLFATSYASCMLTIMAIAARKIDIDLAGATATVEKEMSTTPPRRIAKLTVLVTLPLNLSADIQKKLEDAALHCPVHLSLHPDIIQSIKFIWKS